MNKETLKHLIENEFQRCEDISEFKQEVFKLIDLYENDKPIVRTGFLSIKSNEDSELVPYGELCSCNPKNGGNGVCGCMIGNKLVPKKRGTITTSGPTFNQTKTNE